MHLLAAVDVPAALWQSSESGRAIALIETPTDLEVLDVDATHLVAKRTDEFDVEMVLSYRVQR